MQIIKYQMSTPYKHTHISTFYKKLVENEKLNTNKIFCTIKNKKK